MEPNQQHNQPEAAAPRIGDEEGNPIGVRGIAITISVLALFSAGTLALSAIGGRFAGTDTARQLAASVAVDETPHLEARAAIVYDTLSGERLYEKNAEVQLPLASLTKVMLALVAARTLPKDAEVLITKEALAPEGDTGLRVGERWKLQDLIDATLIPSSNDGAQALALAAGGGGTAKTVAAMNNLARELKLDHTYFLNPIGLDESATQAGAYGSASDIASLFAYAIKQYPDLLGATAQNDKLITSESGIEHTAINTNEALGSIPGLIAGKTGTTDLAHGNLAVAFDASIGHPVVVVVLGSSQEGRFEDVKTLVRFARSALQKQ